MAGAYTLKKLSEVDVPSVAVGLALLGDWMIALYRERRVPRGRESAALS